MYRCISIYVHLKNKKRRIDALVSDVESVKHGIFFEPGIKSINDTDASEK